MLLNLTFSKNLGLSQHSPETPYFPFISERQKEANNFNRLSFWNVKCAALIPLSNSCFTMSLCLLWSNCLMEARFQAFRCKDLRSIIMLSLLSKFEHSLSQAAVFILLKVLIKTVIKKKINPHLLTSLGDVYCLFVFLVISCRVVSHWISIGKFFFSLFSKMGRWGVFI